MEDEVHWALLAGGSGVPSVWLTKASSPAIVSGRPVRAAVVRSVQPLKPAQAIFASKKLFLNYCSRHCYNVRQRCRVGSVANTAAQNSAPFRLLS
jgi:hypothetical protein